jgi:hypothetical protein
MVTTRQAARNARQNGDTLLREEEDTEPQPTHKTSLTPKELRLIHQLCRFQSKKTHHSFDVQLKRHLYRFWCFMPPPYGLRTPSVWNSASWTDDENAPLPTAVARANVLLSRPGALAPIPAPPEPPTPPPLSQMQSPLFSVLPPEIRTRIFEFALRLPTRNGKVRVQHSCCTRHAGDVVNTTIPALAAVSRLVRREALPLFFKVNNFTFAPPTDSIGQKISEGDAGKWLLAMRSHLSSLYRLTFEVWRRDKAAGYDSRDILSVTICHDPQQNRWTTTSDDDWSDRDEADRQSLERDNVLLKQILVPMLERISRNDLTPTFLMWLMEDLRIFYAGEKLSPSYPPDHHWVVGTPGSRPDVSRPPDMYTGHQQHEYWIQRPYWLCSRGHRLELEADGVFRCKCDKA